VTVEQSLRARYLEAMGIEQWVRRDRAVVTAVPRIVAGAPSQGGTAVTGAGGAFDGQNVVSALDWPELESRVLGCTRCALHETRTRTVFGTGNRAAEWMIVGEAPGADEDRQGEPFVGRAGQLLTAMLAAIGLRREEVFVTNVLKCRPPGNRDPLPEEVACCHEYLERQMALVEPALLLVVGRIAAHNLLQTDLPVGRLRGRVHRYGTAGIPLVVTYHPAYLLRSPLEKRRAWEDLQLARQVYRGL
jgi:uracil-DNA glycosylase family 4